MLSIVWDGPQPVNQPWGCTPLTVEPWWEAAGCHWHCGIDIGDPYCLGKLLYAARAGVVTQLWRGILGIQVAGGETDFYVHGTYVVAIGAAIARGQHIGSFGNIAPSGGSTTGPHLHFERQRLGGHLNVPATSLDPVPVLTAAFGGSTDQLEERMHPSFIFGQVRMALAAFQGPFHNPPGDPATDPTIIALAAKIAPDGSNFDTVMREFLADANAQPWVQAAAALVAGKYALKTDLPGSAAPDDDSALSAAVQAAQSAADAAKAAATKVEAAVKAAGAELSQG